ncbi:transmembrane 220 family protein [Leptospira ilyithenensis]|uniref:Transmembrane family 220, helix n=1 Tax=Leptospira ilyithenensis TaxID=2484901 RepID=A0A4V3JWV1_9LEPT|nr:transmembrane 220 family protein [Leptospira ilyithenensis]TGN08518.1 hypothetical protein EHS11_16650 [Leptospira ilyithenensis]
MSILYKIINVVFALLFFTSAALQYNDPDPIHWIFIYGLAAVLCSLAVAGKFFPPLVYISLGAVLLQLLILSDGALHWYQEGTENMLSTPMSKDKPYIEEIREFFGALIVLGSDLFLLYYKNIWEKRKKS